MSPRLPSCEAKRHCPRTKKGEAEHDATHSISWSSPEMEAPAFEHVCEQALRPALNAFRKGTTYKVATIGESFADSRELRA